MEPDVNGMTSLEECLKGEGGSDLRARILSRLTQLDGTLGERVEAGLRPADFARAADMKAAIQLAGHILRGLQP